VFRPVIFKDSSNLFEKRDGPKISQKIINRMIPSTRLKRIRLWKPWGWRTATISSKKRDQKEEEMPEAEGEVR